MANMKKRSLSRFFWRERSFKFAKKVPKGHEQPALLWFFAVLIMLALKYYFFIGSRFNQSLWDNETEMLSDLDLTFGLGYLLKLDAYGYLIIPIRSLFLFAEVVEINHTSLIRVSVILIQILISLIVSHFFVGRSQKIKLMVFVILCSIPIEDMNYIFNIGYYFIVPIIGVWLWSASRGIKGQIFLGLIASLIIVKPLTAVTLLIAIGLEIIYSWKKRLRLHSPYFLGVLFILSLAYLILYTTVPSKVVAPTQVGPLTIFKSLVNLPWVMSTVFTPILNIGVMGFLHERQASTIIVYFVGSLIYFINIGLIYWFAMEIKKSLSRSSTKLLAPIKTINLKFRLVSFCLFASYICAHLISNFYYVTEFPLWTLGYSPRIWMRYSAPIAILAMVLPLVTEKSSCKEKRETLFLIVVLLQYVILWISARNVFLRWYM